MRLAVRLLMRFHDRRLLATCVELQPAPGLALSQRGPCSERRRSPLRWPRRLLICPSAFLLIKDFAAGLARTRHAAYSVRENKTGKVEQPLDIEVSRPADVSAAFTTVLGEIIDGFVRLVLDLVSLRYLLHSLRQERSMLRHTRL